MEIIPGILLNAFVNIIISTVLILFLIFATKRWNKQTIEMKSFFIFWYVILFVFLSIAVRYFLIGLGLADNNPFAINYFIQAMIFSSSPWLIFFAVYRATHSFRAAKIFFLTFFFFVFLTYFYLLNGGMVIRPITEYAAESGLNTQLYIFFSFEIFVILICLLRDIYVRTKSYLNFRENINLYDIYFSLMAIIFLFVGGFDNFQIIPDVYLPIFRLAYIVIFLAVYIIIIKQESLREKYLVEDSRSNEFKNLIMI